MRIVMMTNTYLPHRGGVARSVEAFARRYRQLGHRVLVIAPEFAGRPEEEDDVVRVPAIQHFNGSDFSARLPIVGSLTPVLDRFAPEIIHSHHPFLLGATARRSAAVRNLPIVFTHHTLYEKYTHYVPGDSPVMQRIAIGLSTEYANLCDHVIAPSESVAALLRERGVAVPVTVVPTGVETELFASGDRAGFRERVGLPPDAIVIGHVGRLAPEKNLAFLAEAVVEFVERNTDAVFLVVGSGPSETEIAAVFERRGLAGRLRLAGSLGGQELIDAYHAMDIFAFTSLTETQGMVLTEAMAAGLPVVALDAAGVREVVRDETNGRLLRDANPTEFAEALEWTRQRRDALARQAQIDASDFDMNRSAEKGLAVYEQVLRSRPPGRRPDASAWMAVLRALDMEWRIWAGLAGATESALAGRTSPAGRDAGASAP